MIDIIMKIIKTGTVTKRSPLSKSWSNRAKGKIQMGNGDRKALLAAVSECPTGALSVQKDGKIKLYYGACIFCGSCARMCEPGVLRQTSQFCPAVKIRENLVETFVNE